MALKLDPVVWERDPNLPPGVGVGQPASVREFLENKGSNDPQAARLFLMMCTLTRASFWLRVVRPELTEALVRHHVNVWNCAPPLGTPRAPTSFKFGTVSAGGLGLASAHRVRVASHWASWADCILMVRRRHPFSLKCGSSDSNTGRRTMFPGSEELPA